MLLGGGEGGLISQRKEPDMSTAIEQFILWWTLFWASVGAVGGLSDLPKGGIHGQRAAMESASGNTRMPLRLYYGTPQGPFETRY